jgi:Spy/CpxP family protein refolding chaperone
MKRQKMIIKLMLTAAALIVCGSTAVAQTAATQTEPTQQPAQTSQVNAPADFRFLDLTQDQVQRIRGINAELKDQRHAAGMRLRQAQRALAEAVESPTPDEALISQRSRDVAEAQANTIRFRSLTEARILQVLTPEQRVKLREMRAQNIARRRALQQQGNGAGRQQGLQPGANTQLMTPQQRRMLRRQQQRQRRP